MSPSTSTRSTTTPPTFQRLGVRTRINARGTYTILSGSRVLPQVVEAMREATNHYVNIEELMEKVGERLAELTGAEWGYVTSGCAAALAQVTAACIAGADPEKIARLPDSAGMRNEVIIQKAQRCGYDRAMQLAGAHMVEVTTLAELRAAFSERTAMVAIIGDLEAPGQLPPQTMIAMGHEHGIPTLVDAAAQRPDVPNRYLQMGADAVAYSGGKCLRGPQSSGLVLGRRGLLHAAFLNGAPHNGIGRGMKAGKEEIMGLLAAVEAWVLGRDHQAEWAMWEGYLGVIRAAIADLPSLRTTIQQPGVANVTPYLVLAWDEATLHASPAQVHDALWEGDPSIGVNLRTDGLMVNPYMLEQGEAEVIARCLRQLLSAYAAAPAQPVPAAVAPAVDVSGQWLMHTCYVWGSSEQALNLQQEGATVGGSYRSQYACSPISGQVAGDQISWRASVGLAAYPTSLVFQGTVAGDTMSGQGDLGGYGCATWSAHRVK